MRENMPLSVVLLAVLSVLLPLFGESSASLEGAAQVEKAAHRERGERGEGGSHAKGETPLCKDKRHRVLPVKCVEAFWEPLEHLLYPRWTATEPEPDQAAAVTEKSDKAGCPCPKPDPPEPGCLVPVPHLPSRVQPIVLTVPDPQVTDLKYEFDRAIDSVSRAIEDAGYVRDRFYLPWSQPESDKSGDASCQGKLPGLLLFR